MSGWLRGRVRGEVSGWVRGEARGVMRLWGEIHLQRLNSNEGLIYELKQPSVKTQMSLTFLCNKTKKEYSFNIFNLLISYIILHRQFKYFRHGPNKLLMNSFNNLIKLIFKNHLIILFCSAKLSPLAKLSHRAKICVQRSSSICLMVRLVRYITFNQNKR